jgi:hypothetical protein
VISQTHPHDSPGTHEDHAVGQPWQGEAAWLTGWGPGCGCCRDRHCSDLGIAASRRRPWRSPSADAPQHLSGRTKRRQGPEPLCWAADLGFL